MRMSLTFGGVQARGLVSLRQPLVWPVWFAVDGEALLFLLGDAQATRNVHAPGPRGGTVPLAWDRTLVAGGLPDEAVGIGLAMLYTEGGAQRAETLAAYHALQGRVERLATGLAARASGLDPLLGAFGLSSAPSLPDPKRLAGGLEVDVLERDEEPDAAASSAGFRHMAALLARVVPGASTTIAVPNEPPHAVQPTRPGARPTIGPTPPIDLRRILDRRVLIDAVRDRAPRVVAPAVKEGTVVSSLLQFWSAADVKPGAQVSVRRALPTRTALRTSLMLSGTVRREG